jgi:hypothetical protein
MRKTNRPHEDSSMRRPLIRLIAALACLATGTLTGCVDGPGLGITPASTSFGGSGLSINTNQNPNTRYVSAGQSVTLSVTVRNPAGGNVQFSWSATDGQLSSTSASTVVWVAPSTPGDVNIQVTVSNGQEEVPGAYRLTVR